jgi:hypothetical protein
MSNNSITLKMLGAATEAASLAITEATDAWRTVWQDGAGDNDAATVAWTAVEEAQSVWDDAAWEECEALKGAYRPSGPVTDGLSDTEYEERLLPRYLEAECQLKRLIELLIARRHALASVEPWMRDAESIVREISLMRAFVNAYREEAEAEAELAALREKAAASGDPRLGWEERVAAVGRSVAARKVITVSPLFV